MPIYKLQENKIVELLQTTFSNERIDEARDLQRYIINSMDTIEKNLFVLSCEFGDWEDSKRRIDILCIDKDANLVVVELKRTEDGGHMELQSIRYAAMVANMTFDKAVKAFQNYVIKNNLTLDNPQQEILKFLEWDEINEGKFANDVRIILVSADFSKEITTSVLWLIERDIDIKCIRIRPQKDGINLYFDIQQIIPLPETADYQVKLREKVAEQRQSRREGNRDYSKFDVTINGKSQTDLNKRQTMYFVISESVKFGISPQKLMKLTGERRWIYINQIVTSKIELEIEYSKFAKNYDQSRWFNSDKELLNFEGKTYAFSNQNGKETFDLATKIFDNYQELQGVIKQNGS